MDGCRVMWVGGGHEERFNGVGLTFIGCHYMVVCAETSPNNKKGFIRVKSCVLSTIGQRKDSHKPLKVEDGSM